MKLVVVHSVSPVSERKPIGIRKALLLLRLLLHVYLPIHFCFHIRPALCTVYVNVTALRAHVWGEDGRSLAVARFGNVIAIKLKAGWWYPGSGCGGNVMASPLPSRARCCTVLLVQWEEMVFGFCWNHGRVCRLHYAKEIPLQTLSLETNAITYNSSLIVLGLLSTEWSLSEHCINLQSVPLKKHITPPLGAKQVNAIYNFVTMVYYKW
jgi:hypothetical protein